MPRQMRSGWDEVSPALTTRPGTEIGSGLQAGRRRGTQCRTGARQRAGGAMSHTPLARRREGWDCTQIKCAIKTSSAPRRTAAFSSPNDRGPRARHWPSAARRRQACVRTRSLCAARVAAHRPTFSVSTFSRASRALQPPDSSPAGLSPRRIPTPKQCSAVPLRTAEVLATHAQSNLSCPPRPNAYNKPQSWHANYNATHRRQRQPRRT